MRLYKIYLLFTLFIIMIPCGVAQDTINIKKIFYGVSNGMTPTPHSYVLAFEKQKNHFSYYLGLKRYTRPYSPTWVLYDQNRHHLNKLTRHGIVGGVKYYTIVDKNKNLVPFIQFNLQGSAYDYAVLSLQHKLVFKAKHYVLDLALAYGINFKIFKNIFITNSFGLQSAFRIVNDFNNIYIDRVLYNRKFNLGYHRGKDHYINPLFWNLGAVYSF